MSEVSSSGAGRRPAAWRGDRGGAPAAADTPRRVGLDIKLFYGLGSAASGVATLSFTSALLTPYLTRVIGLPPIWVGAAIMATLMLDSLLDPLLGHWSDKLRSPWGRRHPLIYVASLVCGVVAYLFWQTPRGWPLPLQGAYLIGMLTLMRLGISLFEIPSNALTPELAPDYHERTSLFAYRFFFGSIGGIVMNIVLFRIYLSPTAGGMLNRDGYAHYGVAVAIAMAVPIFLSAAGTHRAIPRLSRPPERRSTFRATAGEVFTVLSNPSLLVVMLAGLISGIASGLGGSLSQFFYLEMWGLGASQVSDLAIAQFVASILGVVVAPAMSRRFGKKTFMLLLLTATLLLQGLPLALKLIGVMPPNSSPFVFPFLLADSFVSTFLALMGLVIVSSMIADIVEDAAVKTGVRSEGLLFSANGLLPKFTAGLGVFFSGVLLAVVHFPIHAAQGTVDPQIMRNLALIYLPMTVTLGAISLAILSRYRIDQSTHELNLERLRNLAAPIDPPPP